MRNCTLALLLTFIFIFSTQPLRAQTILFEENFDDGVANGFTPDSDLWHVNDDGQYQIENWGFEILSHSYFGDFEWTDFMLSMDMRTHDSVQNSVGFRIQENGDMYVAALRGEPYKDVFLFKMINGNQYQLLTQDFSNSLFDWHHLEISAAGNQFIFSVNGEQAFQYTDNSNPFLFGRQALISYTGGVAQHQLLLLDNVVVLNPVVSAETTSLDKLKALFR